MTEARITVDTVRDFFSEDDIKVFKNYLDMLRESGATNMFGARPFLQNQFSYLSKTEASAILQLWMIEFGEDE